MRQKKFTSPNMDVTVTWRGDEAIARTQAAIRSGIEQAAREVLAEAKDRVPVDTGALRASGKVKKIESDRNGTVAIITFGDGLEDARALHVHEKFTSGGAKYLEGPIEQRRHMGTVSGKLSAAL